MPGDSAYDSGKVTLFGVSDVNLMEQCCHSFDSQELVNRKFTLQQSLLLYATLIHKVADTKEFARRARILRNLIAASEDEIRRQSMPALLRDVEYLITSGQWRLFRHARVLTGSLVFLVVGMPWYIAILGRLGRLAGADHLIDRAHRQLGRHLAADMAAHAVAHDEESQIGGEEHGVLILLSDMAYVGAACLL